MRTGGGKKVGGANAGPQPGRRGDGEWRKKEKSQEDMHLYLQQVCRQM